MGCVFHEKPTTSCKISIIPREYRIAGNFGGEKFGKLQNFGDWRVLIWQMAIKTPNRQNFLLYSIVQEVYL